MYNRYGIDHDNRDVVKGAKAFEEQFKRDMLTSGDIDDARRLVITDLVSQARKLTKIAIDQCNGISRYNNGRATPTWTDDDQSRADMAESIARWHVKSDVDYLFGHDLAEIHFNTDPRGASVKITNPRTNVVYYVDGGEG